jgi:hypothetical protein
MRYLRTFNSLGPLFLIAVKMWNGKMSVSRCLQEKSYEMKTEVWPECSKDGEQMG